MRRLIATLVLLLATSVFGKQRAVRTSPELRVVPVSAPQYVTSHGKQHLLWELLLRNDGNRDVTVQSLDVVNPATGQPLASYSGAELQAILFDGTTTIRPDELTAAFLWQTFDSVAALPAALTHRIVTNIGVFNGPLTSVRLATPFVLGAPLHGTSWLAANGPANDTGHRRAVTEINGRLANAQRFAIDWVKIDSRGATFSGNRKVNASYYAYGQDVLAVADGIVASVKDGIPENVPADPPAVPIDLTTIAGNFIVLDVGNGAYVVYAHLQPGSLRVRPGDSVQRGTPLARLGNSGNSTEPHLHLHVCDANSNIACDGLPYVFDHFRSSGVTRTLEIPLRNELVDFD